jgi:dipeptidyl-peptidase-4
MRTKAFIIFLLSVSLTSALQAQKKSFTMQEAVLGLSTNLAVKNMKQLQWMGSSEFYSQVISNDSERVIIAYSPQTFESETIISLEKMNKQLVAMGIKELKNLPAINWISNVSFYIFHDNKYIRFNTLARDSSQTQVVASVSDGAENNAVEPNTMQVAYLKDDNIYIAGANKNSIQLTNDGNKSIVYGKAVHRDEFGIDRGLFWSPSGKYLAFYRMDQSMVEDYPVMDWSETPAKVNAIKYPMAGRASHQVTLGIANVQTGEILYVKTGEPKDQYLTTVTWSPDENYIYVSLLNRDQNHLKMNKYDVKNGVLVRTLFEEKNDKYVEPQHPLYFIDKNPTQFVWWSQRDGYMHLYLYNSDGELIRQLTSGKWIVNELLGYNKKNQELIFTSTEASPLEKNVYAVNVLSGAKRKVVKTNAMHNVQLSAQGNFLIDAYSTMSVPRNIEIVDVNTSSEKRLLTAPNPLQDFNVASVESLQLYASDSTLLYAKLMKPADFDPSKKYPVIVYLYNGPHLQLNKNSFPASGNLWYDYMTQRGYLVFVIDGRGSSNRGFAFESAVHRQLGTLEMEDQMVGVNYLKSLPYVDANRLGIHGWSYGGFMTTSFMLRKPEVFKVGVAGGPVLDWSMYEVMYTERYMDSPEQNKEGYAMNLLLDKTKNLKGKLLMIHGTDDDVVVWQHSLKFIKKAVDEGIQMDYFVYPGHPHNVRGKDRVHLMQKITDYFDAHLK